jgi:uncharacterized transporter YbjL
MRLDDRLQFRLAKTSARAPVISYAAAYPVALIFMTIVAQVLVAALD